MTVNEFKNAFARYIDEYKSREFKKEKLTGKKCNNSATAGKRVELVIKMLDFLGDIDTLDGSPMSAEAPYILNIGDVAEMVMGECFTRLNGFGHNTNLSKSGKTADFYGKGENAYEVKFMYNIKYRCTALDKKSGAKFVYFMTSKAVYKIPYDIALASEEIYGSDAEKHRCINIKNIANAESYILKTYTEILYKKNK